MPKRITRSDTALPPSAPAADVAPVADPRPAASPTAPATTTPSDRYVPTDAASSTARTAAETEARTAVTTTTSEARAVYGVTESGALKDAALKAGFPAGAPLPLRRGASGDGVVAAQYGLARVGFTPGTVDGKYGPGTEGAVRSFQAFVRLPQTGVFDAGTLAALDAKLATTELRTPAEKSGDALGYLSNHAALGLAKFAPIADRSKPINWSHPEVQQAYGKFVGAYWEHLKANRVECDCKTLSLFFMDQFRTKLKADLGVALPRPKGLPESSWVAATASDPKGFFSRFETLSTVRPGYERAQAIFRLDPKASMLAGVNVRYAGVDANMAARAVKVTQPWVASHDNGGDQRVPEVAVKDLSPGDVLFIDHTGDGRVDHMANVIGVDRDASGRVLRVKLATGSFDDMKDADGSTAPRSLGEVNNYAEEVTVSFGEDGKVSSSKVTWSSEPAWLTDGRYSARTLLMEMRPNGAISVGRWAQPG